MGRRWSFQRSCFNELSKVLPKYLSVGTGFVRNEDKITKQIDIIIYNNNFPVLFLEGDFVVTTSANVVGIIEVKSKISASNLCNVMKTANENAEVIVGASGMQLFNGIFSYNPDSQASTYLVNLDRYDFSKLIEKQYFNQLISNKLVSCVNHMAIGDRYFFKLWPLGQDEEDKRGSLSENLANYATYYSLYDMNDGLAFSYFLSNLQEFLIKTAADNIGRDVPKEMLGFLYPLEEGKEVRCIGRVYLNKDHE